MLSRFDAGQPIIWFPVNEAAVDFHVTMPKLIFDLPGDATRGVEVPAGGLLTLGRAVDNAVRIDDVTVSRHHARLTWRGNGVCLIEDLRSANGTTLNDAPLTRPEVLQDGDRLSFGTVTASYLAAEEDAARLPPVEPSAGEMFAGRYRIESSLGETMEYHNFRGEDLARGSQQVSLKIFHPGVITQAGGFERVRREFARVRAATAPAHMGRLLDFGRWRGASYLATGWVEGYPLLDVLRRRGALTVPEMVRLARGAAAATDHARAHGLPSPDLSPRSVLIVFAEPVSMAAWETRCETSVARWPAFALKLSPRLFAPAASPGAPTLPLLGALIYELLGHPASASGASRPARIASLGELGNTILAQWLASAGRAFGDDERFIDALGEAAGVAASGKPAVESPPERGFSSASERLPTAEPDPGHAYYRGDFPNS